MSTDNETKSVSIIGGTGALGSGLARRWARAGYRVIIGSRSAERARESAAKLSAELSLDSISGAGNREAAAAADVAVLTVPFAHQAATLREIAPALAGKILVDTTVPLVPPKVARVQLPAEGCAALIAQEILGDAVTVVSAFQNVAADLVASDEKLDCDVLVAGDKPEAREVAVKLAESAGMRAWHAGPLVNSIAAEALTSVLIFINRKNPDQHAGLRITGIADA